MATRKQKVAAKAKAWHGLVEVPAPAGSHPTLWVDPASLRANPDNWKLHPEDQTRAVSALIARHGWLKPLVYNARLSRLADGHDRLEIALDLNYAAVPVVVIDCDEADEAEILVGLDETARMAKGDPARLQRLLQRLRDTSEPIGAMLARMKDREGVTALLKRMQAEREKVDAPATPAPPPPMPAVEPFVPEPEEDEGPSGRVFPLPFGPTDHDEFTRLVGRLMRRRSYASASALVLDLAREADASDED